MVGATARPISRPNAASSVTVSGTDRRAANRMLISTAIDAIHATSATAPVRSRPSQAPAANSAAVSAT